jgi:hypothetical protein
MTLSANERKSPTYARDAISTTRYSRADVAALRAQVCPLYDAPTEEELEDLVDAFEQIHGRMAKRAQRGYLNRLFRIHGPNARRLLVDLHAQRGTTENLLLAVEVATPAWARERTEQIVEGAEEPEGMPPALPAAHPADPQHAVPALSADAPPQESVPGDPHRAWRCRVAVGRDHVRKVRPDGTGYCGTCHP